MKFDQDNQINIVDPESGNLIETEANSEDQFMHDFLNAAKGPATQLTGLVLQFGFLWLASKFARH